MNLEDYIKDLSPDLQEKARGCESVQELLALAKEAQVPVPDVMLESIAGGDGSDFGVCKDITCPKCGSDDVSIIGTEQGAYCPTLNMKCNYCGHEWDITDFQ